MYIGPPPTKISINFKIKIAIAVLSFFLDSFLMRKIYIYLRISIERMDLGLIMVPIFLIVLFSYGLMLFDVKISTCKIYLSIRNLENLESHRLNILDYVKTRLNR